MGIVFRQSVKTTIVNFAGALLGGISVFIFSSFFATKTQFGLTRNLVNAGAIMQYLVMLGTSALIYTYTQKYPPGDPRRKTLLTLCAIVPVITTLILTVPYVLYRGSIVNLYQDMDRPLINRFFLWLPVLVLLWTLMSYLEAYLGTQMKVAYSSFMKEVMLRICTLVAFCFYYPLYIITFDQFVMCMVLAYAVPLIMMLMAAVRTGGFGFSNNWKAFSKDEYKELVHFAWYHLLFGISIYIMGFVDQMMLAPLDKHGVSSLSVYGNAVYICTLIVLPYRAITLSVFPMLNKAYLANEHDTLNDLFHRSGVNILIVAIGMLAIVGCNLPNAVAIFPKGYEDMAQLTLILMLGKLIDMATGMNNELISISRLYKFNFYVALLLLVLVIVFNRFMIPKYGMYGAAWASTLALAIFNIIKMTFLWKKMDLLPFTNRSWRVLVAGAVAGAAGYYMPFIYTIVGIEKPYILIICDVALRSVIILSIYAGLLIFLKPSADLNSYVQSVVKNKRLF